MAYPVFPTGLFGFNGREYGIEGQTLRGPTSLSGEQDVSSTDGGGRVFAELSGGALLDREKVLAWRALLTGLEDGVTPHIVYLCDKRHSPYGGEHLVPHSDGTPLSDGSLYSGGGPTAEIVADAPLRAVSLVLAVTSLRPLIGGEWFSIEHPAKGWRAYTVKSVADDGTVTFRPPLREAVTAGDAVELSQPRCLMIQEGKASRRLDYGRLTEAAIRFVEAP